MLTVLPIIQYWHEEEPPPRILDGLASFVEQNPVAQHLVFSENTATKFIAKHFSDRELAAFSACAHPAMQADYFRYCAVLALGGVYADADLRCVTDLRPLACQAAGTLFATRHPNGKSEDAVFKYPFPVGPYFNLDNSPLSFREPGHPVLELAVEIATANIENRVADGPSGVWLTAGPGVLTSIYIFSELGSIQAFLAYTEGTVLEPSASLFCECVWAHSEVADALADVEVRPREERKNWLRPLAKPAPGEQGPHWGTITGSIFK